MTQASEGGGAKGKKNNKDNSGGKGGTKGTHVVFKKTERKWKVEEKEIDKLVERYAEIDTSQIKSFAELPLSAATQKGLKDGGFSEPTGEGWIVFFCGLNEICF